MTTKTETAHITEAHDLLAGLKEENRMAAEDQDAISRARDLLAEFLAK